MNQEQDDVKRLLGAAFGPEPPLMLDRAELLRAGQRRVRRRRIAASGGVAASVVAVVVGVVALTGLGRGEVDQAAPVSTTGSAIPTTTDAPTVSDGAPAGPQLPLTTKPGAIPPTSDEHAAALAGVLIKSGVVPPPGLRVLTLPSDSRPLSVEHYAGAYHVSVDVSDGKRQGNLSLEIGYATPDTALPGCQKGASCELVAESGIPMLATTEKQDATLVVYYVWAVRPDGTQVQVSSSNAAKRAVRTDPAARADPPVDPRILRVIAALPGLTFK